jgi:cell division initiation protein
MAWTAVDIRNQRFRLRWRGFDPEEVVLFLNVVADEVERLTQTIRQLEHDNRVLQEQLEEYRERERHIRNTLVAAQQSADRIRQQAQQEAELIIKEAEFRRDQILTAAQAQIQKIYQDMEQLWLEYQRFQDQVLAEAHVLIRWIQQRRQERPPARVDLVPATKSPPRPGESGQS